MKIAIQGPMCSGKTTLANMIMNIDKRYTKFSFGQPIKDLATELFNMKGKDRSLLISIADKMREIDQDVWVNYTLKKTQHNNHCIVDDLRFQNEVDKMKGWTIISLQTPIEERIKRIKRIYPTNYEDHISNMNHLSEKAHLNLPENTIYIDTTTEPNKVHQMMYVLLEKNK